jgi:Gpi18-like mannosyltransferase
MKHINYVHRVINIFLAARIMQLFIIILFNQLIPHNSMAPLVNYFYKEGGTVVENLLSTWDGQWFWYISENGYFETNNRDPGIAKFAFFPLYPYINGLLYKITGISVPLIGLVINLVAGAFSSVLLFKMARLNNLTEKVASQSVFWWAINPAAIFYLALYSDSLYFCLSLFTLLNFYQQNYKLACIGGVLAGLTRTQGLLLFPVMVVDYFAQKLHKEKSKLKIVHMLTMLSPLLGVLTKVIHDWTFTRNPLTFFSAMEYWSIKPGVIEVVSLITNSIVQFNQLPLHNYGKSKVDVLFFILYIIGLLILIKTKTRMSLIIYSTLILFAALSSGTLAANVKYYSVAFPIYLALAKLSDSMPAIQTALLILFIFFMSIFSLYFVNWYWVS